MRVVGQEPGIETLRQLGQVVQRRQVAVHGKDAVGHDERARMTGAVRRHKRFGVFDIAMAIAVNARAAELGAGVNTGVRQFIDQDQVVGPARAGMIPILAR